MCNKIQIQSVIYKNNIDDLFRAVEGINYAIKYVLEQGMAVSVNLIYGDGSPEPVFSEADCKRMQDSYSYLNFEYTFFNQNTGTALGHNKLAEKCNSDYMLIMNPDVVMDPCCLYELLKPFSDVTIGMVEARQAPLELAKYYDFETMETEWASTACTIFKTTIFKEIGGFDYKTFFMYCDDLDFSWRMRLNGYRILYNPSAVVYHSKSLSNKGEWQPTSAEIYYSAEAALLMAHKYSNPERVERLLHQFEHFGGADEKKAAGSYRKRKIEETLPTPIDPDHKVAKFVGDYYSEMRFNFNR